MGKENEIFKCKYTDNYGSPCRYVDCGICKQCVDFDRFEPIIPGGFKAPAFKCSNTAGTCVNYYNEKCLLNLKPKTCERFRVSGNPLLKEQPKGKCKHTDCIHYGEICCAMESECDGEEWYNKMPDGEIVRQQPKQDEGVGLEVHKILSELKPETKITYGQPIVEKILYIDGIPLACEKIQQLLTNAKADAIKGERTEIIKIIGDINDNTQYKDGKNIEELLRSIQSIIRERK